MKDPKISDEMIYDLHVAYFERCVDIALLSGPQVLGIDTKEVGFGLQSDKL